MTAVKFDEGPGPVVWNATGAVNVTVVMGGKLGRLHTWGGRKEGERKKRQPHSLSVRHRDRVTVVMS